MLSERERFLSVLGGLPIAEADCIVLLTGDGMTRLPSALQLFKQGGAPRLLVSGGLQNPPYSLNADHFTRLLIEAGVAPSAILTEGDTLNTRASADACTAIAKLHEWKRVLLVTSSYHMPRAFLSFIAAQKEVAYEFVVIPVAVTHPWFAAVGGLEEQARIDLLDLEAAKVSAHQATGDVASFADGIEAIRRWEGAC